MSVFLQIFRESQGLQRCLIPARTTSIKYKSLVSTFTGCCVHVRVGQKLQQSVLSQLCLSAHLPVQSRIPTDCYFIRQEIRNISRKSYIFPVIDEADLKEDFVRGSGPGGQSVNQTSNCVVLKHVPSGIVVKCHETRSLDKNRRRARERLQDRLDLHLNGDKSFLSLLKKEKSDKKRERKKKNKKQLELKKGFKRREGLD